MQAVAFYIAYPVIWLISRMPFPIVYGISDVVYFLLYYVIRYRRETIIGNLKIAFPEKNDAEIVKLCKKSTSHFCDLFIEMIKSTGISKEELQRRFLCDNVNEIDAFAKANQPIVVLIGHQASYEWTMALDGLISFKTFAVYKPLRNKYFDQFIRDVRSKFGSFLVPMKMAYAKVKENQTEDSVGLFALIADQAPKRSSAQYFTQFFGKTTPVFMGGERMAHEYGMPVYFLRISKIKRGYYSSHFEKISDNGSLEKMWHITDSFFIKLEEQIKRQPEFYLWSHKRWKTGLDDATRAVELSPRVPQ